MTSYFSAKGLVLLWLKTCFSLKHASQEFQKIFSGSPPWVDCPLYSFTEHHLRNMSLYLDLSSKSTVIEVIVHV